FGASNTDFSPSLADLLSGPPRIAMLWTDLNPSVGGTITAAPSGPNFVITYSGVPEYSTTNSNSFTLTLRPDNTYNVDYPGFDATGGLVGESLGNGVASDPGEIDLSAAPEPISGAPGDAVYEFFQSADNDLSGDNLDWDVCPDFSPTIAPAQPGVIYATTGGSTGGANLYTINEFTGAATLIGPTGVTGMPGLAINSSGEIWGTQRTSGSLYRVDAATGQAIFQTTVDVAFVDAIAFDAGDVLYGIGFDPPDFMLRKINTSTGVTTPVGPTGDVFVGLAFHPVTGVLYGSTGGFQPNNPDGIAKINLGTGAATFIGTTGLGGPTPDLVFGSTYNLYGVKGGGQGANNFISVSQVNGAGAVVGATANGISGMASWIPIAVPTLLQAFKVEPGDGAVKLHWDVHTTGNDLVGFRVHRRDPSGDFTVVNEVPLAKDVRNYVDATVQPGKRYVYKLEIVNEAGEFYSPEVPVTAKALKLELAQCTPNPFNPSTTIGYTVPTRVNVTLQIFDVAGRLVTTLVDEQRAAGRYSAAWNGLDARGNRVSSGVYFYRLSAGKNSLTRKMVLLK
ncbi:MAG TPA: FlgD immunoglobulin-like domain containing protein, partial [Candidatus Krumholzibacteria bacterium]|nr:FlgD immunoglobulin-like domain containing protein [Candidatus Krumholzibacteria bacterium]